MSWDHDGLIPASRVSAVINLKLEQNLQPREPDGLHLKLRRSARYPHGGPPHPSVDAQGALTCGSDALHHHAEHAAAALLGLAHQAVIQVHFSETPQRH